MRVVLALVVAMISSQLLANTKGHNQVVQSTQASKEYVIGVESIPYFPLYDFSTKNFHRPNFTRELLAHFFKQQGYRFRFQPLPIKRVDSWFIEQNIDFKFPDNPRWRALANSIEVNYSKPALRLVAGTTTLAKNTNKTQAQIDSLATMFGFVPVLWHEQLKASQIRVQYEDTPLSIVKHLLHENVMATNIDQNVLRYYHELYLSSGKINNSSKIVLNKSIYSKNYGYHLSSVRYPDILRQFDQFLQNNTEFITQLKRKYKIIEEF